MLKSKKFIIIALVTVVVLGAAIGGVSIAQAEEPAAPTQTGKTALLDKVAEIYQKNTGTAIDPAELKKAFTEAGKALADEAFNARLQQLVKDGRITQEQADAYKTWLAARPAFPTDEFKAWLDSRPADIPFGPHMGPGPGMMRGFGKTGGMFRGGMRGW